MLFPEHPPPKKPFLPQTLTLQVPSRDKLATPPPHSRPAIQATDSPSRPAPRRPWGHLRRLELLPQWDRSHSWLATMAFHVFPLSSLGVTP